MYYKYPDVDRLTQWLIDNKDYLSSPVEVTEKLDGSNFSFYKSNGEAIWRSRCTKLGLPCVGEIARGTFTLEELLNMRAGESAIGEAREGIVIKDYDKQFICKLVDPKYEESHTQKPPRVPVVIHEETQEFVNIHCTENRVLKAIFRLHDEDGETFNMSMMGLLPRAVEADIYKECNVPETINVKQMKKMIADISRETLNKYLNGEIE